MMHNKSHRPAWRFTGNIRLVSLGTKRHSRHSIPGTLIVKHTFVGIYRGPSLAPFDVLKPSLEGPEGMDRRITWPIFNNVIDLVVI